MAEFIAAQFVPLMFAGLLVFLLTGFPVAFALAATGLFFGFIGMEVGLFQPTLFQVLPQRVFAIMQNDTLLAIPFFTLMGIILERSRMAEDLLSTVAQVFGPVRGGLAVAVVLVGALLAATTGVVAASSAPTRITATARPPRTGPNTWPTVDSRSSAMRLRSRMMPMSVKNGMASSVSFCMMANTRCGMTWNSVGWNRPSSMPRKPKVRPVAASANATGKPESRNTSRPANMSGTNWAVRNSTMITALLAGASVLRGVPAPVALHRSGRWGPARRGPGPAGRQRA